MNILWENYTLRIRDIHLFDENMPSVYEKTPVTVNECSFFTLPFVDGYIWSKKDLLAGLRLKALVGGKEVLLEGGDPAFTRVGTSTLHITWPLTTVKGEMSIELTEKGMMMILKGGGAINWWLDLTAEEGAKLPFVSIGQQRVDCAFEGMSYAIRMEKGTFSKPAGEAVFRMKPQASVIRMVF